MASKMGFYNVEDFMTQKKLQEKDIRVPPKANFLAAANHIRNLFEGKKFVYGVMGGLEMLCLGSRREMPDLQIAYDDRDFHRIKAKLEGDHRIRLPDGMNSLFPAKILVRTGPAYKDEGCTQTADIEVDLLPPGSHGTPPNDSLASNLVLLSLKTEGKLKSYKGLNMLYLVKTLVQYSRVRDLAWDPRKDILFLCQHYGAEVQSIRNQLDQKALQQNFLGTPFFSRLSPEEQRRCYQILLGTEPPPTMAITPPPPISGHKHSASASDATKRPQIPSHKSTPSLNAQISPDLLSPPLLGKPNTSRQRSANTKTQISELPAAYDMETRTPSELEATARESRSRYRPISAPTSHEISPLDARTTAPKSVHTRQFSQSANPAKNLPVSGMQQQFVQQLQPPTCLAPAPTGAQGARSMPNLNSGFTGAVPPYASAQTPSLNGFTTFPQQLQTYISPVEMSATPVPLNPGQQHMKSQLGLGGAYLPQQNQTRIAPITERPIPPQKRTSRQVQQPARAELSGTPVPEVRTERLRIVNAGEVTAINLQSSPAIVASTRQPPSMNTGSFHSAQRDPNSITQPPSAPVELDTISQLGQFIAELSVERSTPAPEQHLRQVNHQHAQIQQVLDVKAHTASTFTDSPLSSPESMYTPVAQHQDIPIRPLNPRTQSVPAPSLPASLMVGGPAPQRSPTSTSPQAQSAAPATAPNTNASIYTPYYTTQTPPSSTPSSPQPAYKAYQPPPMSLISPPSLPPPSPDTATDRPSGFGALKDVDGASGYFRHKRDVSHDSQTSNASHDSNKLAQEYRAELPGYGEGYGSPGWA